MFQASVSPPDCDNVCISPFGTSFFVFYYETLPLGPLPPDPLLFNPPTIAIQPGAHEINLFSTDHETLSQNAEASRSRLRRPDLTLDERDDSGAARGLYDQIALSGRPDTQTSRSNFGNGPTCESQEYGQNFIRFSEPTHRSMAIGSASAHTHPRFSTQRNLCGRTQFISMALALGRAVYLCALYAHAWNSQLNSRITSEYTGINNRADSADIYSCKLSITHADDGHGPTYDTKKFTNAVQSDKYPPDSCQTCSNQTMIFARMLGRAPNVQLINPITAVLIRLGLLNFPTQEEINVQHSIQPYQQQAGPFTIQQQGPLNSLNIQQPFPQAPQAQNYFASQPHQQKQQQYIQGQNPFSQITYQGQFTPIVPNCNVVTRKYAHVWDIDILFNHWATQPADQMLTNQDLQIKLASFLLSICFLRITEISEIDLNLSNFNFRNHTALVTLSPKTTNALEQYEVRRTVILNLFPNVTLFTWLQRLREHFHQEITTLSSLFWTQQWKPTSIAKISELLTHLIKKI
ncbi:MAG: hypothetical protein EZS28_035664 [Streblomastix strix]|uniref:Tyr recombinase domain-containing protein n=1 Tax=Streblomastix strix TaxID=222440 RepID=A0A5J4UDV4_9EUKA|nr:MAG: hypothetical protein EZS28_035664 [Streblomastix strix]